MMNTKAPDGANKDAILKIQLKWVTIQFSTNPNALEDVCG